MSINAAIIPKRQIELEPMAELEETKAQLTRTEAALAYALVCLLETSKSRADYRYIAWENETPYASKRKMDATYDGIYAEGAARLEKNVECIRAIQKGDE